MRNRCAFFHKQNMMKRKNNSLDFPLALISSVAGEGNFKGGGSFSLARGVKITKTSSYAF